MPVAIRKRSWEDHVTHPSGLQYSYDDLDLICCHGVDSEGLWRGSGASKQGRWTRCTSMPEGCHQLFTDELTPSPDVTTSGVHEIRSEDVKLTDNVKAPLEMKFICSLHKCLDGAVQFNCVSQSDKNGAMIFCATDKSAQEAVDGKDKVGTENDDDVFKNSHICRNEQQCISLSSNNGPPLLQSAAGQPGKPPICSQTKEGHPDSDSRPPEISEATPKSRSATQHEPRNDLPDVEEVISIPGHAGAKITSDVGVHGSLNKMDSLLVMSLAQKAVEPLVTSTGEGKCDKGAIEPWTTDSSDELLGLNNPETLNEKSGHELLSRDIQEGKQDPAGAWDTAPGCEMPAQTLSEQRDSETGAMKMSQGEERSDPERCEKIDVSLGPITSADICAKVHCCLANSKVPCEQEESRKSEEDQTQKIIIQEAEPILTMTTASQPNKDFDESSLSLETIPEANQVEAAGSRAPAPKNLTATIHCQKDDENAAREKHPQKLLPLLAEVNNVIPPEGLHGNEASGRLNESPGSEMADGERHTQSADSRTEQADNAAQEDIPCDTSPVNPAFDGMRQSGIQKEEEGVKVRIKKRDHARLDSMVLLMMKLDQLDQEIENALSANSSIGNTPTLPRRRQLDFDLESPYSYGYATPAKGTPTTLGAKPKSGSSAVPERTKAEIEAKEACTWLRAAGFPQYAQLYEDAQFPIDISSVTRDHDFLDRDAIEALCRRLKTLNKCALMRLEISPQRKRSEDSDEDEPCAISGRWTFQRDSKRWSRMEELDVFSSLCTDGAQPPSVKDQVSKRTKMALCEGNSSESVLTDLSEQPEVGSIHSSGSGGRTEEKSLPNEAIPVGATRASSVASMCSSSGTGGSVCANEDSLSDGLPPSPLELGQFNFDLKMGELGGSLDRGGSSGKSTRSRAKSFLKRMESLRLRSGTTSKRKKKGSISGGKIEISGPVIKEGLDDDKLRKLNCVDIPSLNLNQNLNHHPTQTMTLNRNRSVSYSTQTSNGSTGSTGSSQSEASSGSAVSTPSPVTRARSHSIAAGSGKRGGMYLEGFDPFSIPQKASDRQPTPTPKSAPPIPCQANVDMSIDEQNRRNNHRAQENGSQAEEGDEGRIFFYLPEGHKPGTFPKALQDGSSPNNNGNDNGNAVILRGRQSRRLRRVSSGSVDSRLSFYDNVPYSEREEAPEGDVQKLEEVLQHVSGLQRFVNAWSEAVVAGEEDDEEEEEEEGDSDSALDSASPCPSSPLQNHLEEAENGSDQDSTGNPLGEGEEGMRERRDSGVGASLTRTSRPQKLRWVSFHNSHRPSLASAQLQISCQSVLQMNLLQKLSLLQLTALLERHTPTNKHGFSWAVPKFMKRMKVRDYKGRNVFGVPLLVIVQRTGQPLPQGIQQAMRYLRNQCLDQVGLFRKSGVKSRIQALRQMNEAGGADGASVTYEGQSAYDVADMLKQYFRDLPEPLLTSKLSETFLQIYQYMPKELRLQAARAAVLLLPDENREALRTLLCLLSDVTASVGENQMTPTNLAVCLAPSVFHLNTLRRKESSSPRVMNRKQSLGKPDQRDLNENLAATHGLAHMIMECRKLFRIPEEMSRCRNSYVEQALLPRRLEELSGSDSGGYRSYLRDALDALLKEAKDKFKGYDSFSTPEQAELAYRKVHDGFPLRLWKATVEVPASPEEVLTRIVREQARWDEDLYESRVVESLDEKTEVYQYVRNTMAPHPMRDHLVLRTWITDLPKGACALVSTSVDHSAAPVVGVRANVFLSRYFIEPCGANKSRLTHISRIDCRGRFPEWYNKLHGHLCAAEAARIRDSFVLPTDK
ncbi:rho GTPase-activating protein 7 isoform X1 [Syngnathus typhle]|uniref:rho GTPase-activating protein 7 isoform X1 n=1 Tax=Syngnathus typhle TaxID=161592 RepID=UPI002A6B038E|nr:rho GTPase-activating protein 7 isoform X1 [Syngnathus typhle]